jgi:uncharacterized protein YacL
MIILAAVGWNVGETLHDEVALRGIPQIQYVQYALAVVGAALGFALAPWLSIRPLFWVQKEIRRIPIQSLVAATVGLAIGLLISVPIAYAASFLPFSLGKILPIVGALVLGYLGIMTAITRQKDLFTFIGGRWGRGGSGQKSEYVLLDTSVIIDGRIEYVSQTGFIEGTLLVPRFVLNEIQHIADSPDTLRRNRGRRGLEVLNKLQKNAKVTVEITDMDVEDADDVDGKLIRLASKLKCPIVTNDYNLNRVAGLQGVKVLNINELANAVKTLILPGETIKVRIIQEGKELGQGVGYLDDGTMVVVDNGRRFINNTLEVTVTRVLQTDKGRMMFATPDGGLAR